MDHMDMGNPHLCSGSFLVGCGLTVPDGTSGFNPMSEFVLLDYCYTLISSYEYLIAAMNILILTWVLTNFTLLAVAQPDVTLTTLEMLQSDWAATIVAAKTNPR